MARRRKRRVAPSKRATTLVTRAERAAGGMRALARKLGVSPSTVHRWRTKGITEKGRQKLEGFKEERAQVRRTKKQQRRTFEELMKEARVKEPELKEHQKLPHARTKEGKRSGPLTQGYRYTRAWNRMISPDLISDIVSWLHGLKKRYPVWQAVTIISQYGKGEHKGYKTVYFQLPHPETGDFAISAQIPTKKGTVKEDVISSMEEKLEELLDETAEYGDEEAEDNLVVYVHSTTMFNYRMRTERERQMFVTAKRKERRKIWLKRQRKTKT